MPERGRFIVLEGGEGAGKSTQVALLSAWMEASGVDHVVTREPGGTELGEEIRSVVLDRTDLDIPPVSELFLILAARAAFVRDVVRPALAQGRVVVADRFALSTLAYQGHGRGLPLDEIREANRLATGDLEPDLYLLLDVEVEVGARRQAREGTAPDRMEGEGGDFRRRVREGYVALSESEPGVRVVPGGDRPEAVHQRIRTVLQAEFPETFQDGAV